jgi:hypothetical protein
MEVVKPFAEAKSSGKQVSLVEEAHELKKNKQHQSTCRTPAPIG